MSEEQIGEEAVTPNSHQVGGLHYAAEVQHWDWVEANGMGYLEACASKYATRNRKKHESPIIDIQKAIHYTEKLIDLNRLTKRNWFWSLPLLRLMCPWWARRVNRIRRVVITPEAFAVANRLTYHEAEVCKALTHWTNSHDLWYAVTFLKDMLQHAERTA